MSRVFVASAAVLWLSATPPGARADDGQSSASLMAAERCEGTERALLACVAGYLRREDARLNRVYQALMARLPADRQATLREAQRRWISGRDAGCEGEDQGDDKAGKRYVTHCLLQATEGRIYELEQIR